MSADFQAELRFLGMESSPAFLREPEGNGCIERFFRTLKEQLLWVRHFETTEELTEALLEFRQRYNSQWLIERLQFQSPAVCSSGPACSGACRMTIMQKIVQEIVVSHSKSIHSMLTVLSITCHITENNPGFYLIFILNNLVTLAKPSGVSQYAFRYYFRKQAPLNHLQRDYAGTVLNVAFISSFVGDRIFYMAARDVAERNSGWQAKGRWTVQ
jgi:hypothetical protein